MPRSASRPAEVRSRKSDSGVVMRMSAGAFANRARSAAGVSPVRVATVTSGTSIPSRPACWAIPASGLRRFRSTSTARAFRGETYRTRQRRAGSEGIGAACSRSRAQRNAASVLPLPVGATTSTCSPVAMADQACSCAGVGAANAASSQACVAGVKPAGMFAMVSPRRNASDRRDSIAFGDAYEGCTVANVRSCAPPSNSTKSRRTFRSRRELVAFALASISAIPMTGTTCSMVMTIVGPL